MKISAFLLLTLLQQTCIAEPQVSEENTEGPSQPPQPQYPLRYIAKIHPRGSCPSHEDIVNLTNEFRQNISELLTTHSCGGTPGWRRVAYLDMTDRSQSCPPGLVFRFYISSRLRTCGKAATARSSSTFYKTGNAEYSRVCGRVRGYQIGAAYAFFGASVGHDGIDDFYVSGVSLTHGQSGSRTHIWTFAVSVEEEDTGLHRVVCPCVTPRASSLPPDFVGSDYFCESGTKTWNQSSAFFSDDPLWDGQNCPTPSSCCELNNPPYFTKTLPTPTTDDIELRISAQDVHDYNPIDQVEIYVQ